MLLFSKKAVAFSACFLAFQSQASVIINGTRVIYQEDKKETTVSLTNKNTVPVLIQSWIDTGDQTQSPEKIKVPFVLTPPVNRVDPEMGQTLRINYVGSPALPRNHESVFWLNVLEIRGKAKGTEDTANQQQLNIAYRTRIKLFFRPSGLSGDSNSAAEDLHWSYVNNHKVSVNNPSGFYVSITGVHYKNGTVYSSVKGQMLAPGGTQSYELNNTGASGKLSFTAINDYGATIEYSAKG